MVASQKPSSLGLLLSYTRRQIWLTMLTVHWRYHCSVTFNSQLWSDKHINKACSCYIWALRHVCHIFSDEVVYTVGCIKLMSCIHYCNALLYTVQVTAVSKPSFSTCRWSLVAFPMTSNALSSQFQHVICKNHSQLVKCARIVESIHR